MKYPNIPKLRPGPEAMGERLGWQAEIHNVVPSVIPIIILWHAVPKDVARGVEIKDMMYF